MVTDKAGTIKKGPVIADTIADHLAEKTVHHPGEADIPTAQADTINTASMDHHTAQIDIGKSPHHMHTKAVPLQLQFRNPVKHQAVTLMTSQQKPSNVKTDAPPPIWKTLHLPIIQ